jgi:MFS family permease
MTDTTLDSVRPDPLNAEQRWNFAVNVWDMVFIWLGMNLVSRETVMPLLVAQLTDSKFAIGLIPAIFSLGVYLPQLLVANFSERLRYKLPYILWVSGPGERGAYLLIGMMIWWLAKPAPTLTLILFFLLYALAAICVGVATPAWFDMIAKIIPTHRRGLFSGVGHSVGAFLSVIGAYFVGRILTDVTFPNNFALLFVVGFLAMAISWVGLFLTREPPSTTLKERVPMVRYFARLPTILSKDRNYARFLFSRTITQFGTLASGFYVVYGTERFALSGADIGLLTGTLVASSAVMNMVWGVIGDRAGHKLVLACSAWALTLAALMAWLSISLIWLLITFLLLGIYSAGDGVSGLNIILEFAPPEERPTYIGLTNTLLAPMLVLAPLAGGWLATVAGYHGLFVVTMLIASLGGLLMMAWVREPRGRLLAG